jgi:hypothetical protein
MFAAKLGAAQGGMTGENQSRGRADGSEAEDWRACVPRSRNSHAVRRVYALQWPPPTGGISGTVVNPQEEKSTMQITTDVKAGQSTTTILD